MRTLVFKVDLPGCQPGPGWWKKVGEAMPKRVSYKREWRATKATPR